MRQRKSIPAVLLSLALLLSVVMSNIPFARAVSAIAAPASDASSVSASQPPAEPLAQTSTITLSVFSARTEPFWGAPLGEPNPPGITQGDAVTNYEYIINVDNTGNPVQPRYPDCYPYADPPDNTIINVNYPAGCDWPGVREVPGHAPIATQGNQDDFNGVLSSGITLPPGKYLISVEAEGFKLGGQWFTIPLEEPGLVEVALQPYPLPSATIRARVFEDNSITNGAPDAPVEQGLAGFVGHVADWAGEATTDVYGNPLCTEYEPGPGPNGYLYEDGAPVPIPGSGGQCLSDANGDLVIPNMGPNRWAVSAVPPDGSNWIQSTTLEGNKDWDTWIQEGATGFDTEFVTAGEAFPFTIFGYVKPTAYTGTVDMPISGGPAYSGEIQGVIAEAEVYVPYNGGLPYQGHLWGGLSGAKISKVIENPVIVLTDLLNGDTAVYVGVGNSDGSFLIRGVPDGNYSLTYWDEPLMHILDLVQVTVQNGEVVDMGVLFLTGWYGRLEGTVFADENENGKFDPDEHPIEGYPVVLRRRDNSETDRGAIFATTDPAGHYLFENTYPFTQWIIVEAYTDNYYTTGVTWQASNQPEETTVLGNGVDVGLHPVIGQSGRLDWGVKQYTPGTNGGIVGSVLYDTTRNELDARLLAAEPWSAGVPNMTVNLYATVKDVNGVLQYAPDGSVLKGALLNSAETETWDRPQDCQVRDVDSNPVDQFFMPPSTGGYDCLESPMTGMQFQNGFQAIDGNYGFSTIFSPSFGITDSVEIPMPLGDYLVEVVVPTDPILGRPLYTFTREEDINVFGGDEFISPPPGDEPNIPPPACAGPMHVVDVAGIGPGGVITTTFDGPNAVYNPTFAAEGGSPFEGVEKPLCNVKLVTVSDQRSIAPIFNIFTSVPIAGRFYGYMVDDLNISTNPMDQLFGEKAGVPNAPIGIYDFTNRLVTTIQTDPNGIFEVLLPSTLTINCASPSGVCANLYRIVGNDPGQPGHVNPNYSPQFRTIAAIFEVFPGINILADLAPTQIGVSIQSPGSQINGAVACELDPTTPQLYAVDKAYVFQSGADADRTVTIKGLGFGATQGSGLVLLDNTSIPVISWSDRQVVVLVPASIIVGPHQLTLRVNNGQSWINGLTLHMLGDGVFPLGGTLDAFNRANGGLGASWGGDGNTQTIFRINANNVQVRGTGNTWRTTAVFGANQEAFFTFVTVSSVATEQGLLLKFNGANPNNLAASFIAVSYDPTTGSVVVRTKESGQPVTSLVTQATFPATFAGGDRLGARTRPDGTVRIFKNTTLIGSVNLLDTATPWSAANISGGGRIGVRFVGATSTNFARFDNFGGGTVAGVSYLPNVFEVGPGKPYTTIQTALEDASAASQALVVVYPGTPGEFNPRGVYYENIVVHSPVKLQGLGPGGVYTDTLEYIPGSIISGLGFGGDTNLSEDWRILVENLTRVGNQEIYEGAVVTVFAEDTAQFTSAYRAAIDGLTIEGGDQQGFPNNINQIGGGGTGQPPNVTVQGGGIFVNGYAHYLQITNNLLQSNGGAYGGAVRLGTPNLPAGDPNKNAHNDHINISRNFIKANGGTNLAGALGIFEGSDSYTIAYNELCGNFSAEYGGAVSHYGYSPLGMINNNRIYFNRSYDEGGGIMIAGELPASPSILSPGAGPVNIFNNIIQANLANDDGGGIRFLMAGNYTFYVVNNMIMNNVSTHEGGGVSLNDAPDVRVINNTIMWNLTTATATTSNGAPAPAGLSTVANSDLLQATLPGGSPLFSKPLMFNNIFWENRAGSWNGAGIAGIGQLGDPNPINYWDLGAADGSGLLEPTNSMLMVDNLPYIVSSPTNLVGVDPLVQTVYTTTVSALPWRTNPNFVGVILVAFDVPPQRMGNFHLSASSPAFNLGAASKNGVPAPTTDIDGDSRPSEGGIEIGADETGPLGGFDLIIPGQYVTTFLRLFIPLIQR